MKRYVIFAFWVLMYSYHLSFEILNWLQAFPSEIPRKMLDLNVVFFQHQYDSALFWADKIVSLSNGKSLI